MHPSPRPALTAPWRSAALPLLAAVALLAVFWSVGAQTDEHALGLGSTGEVTPRYGRFLAYWTLLGGAAALALALAFHRLATPARQVRWRRLWYGLSDRRWIAYGSLLALAVAVAVRHHVLLAVPVTDDESAYRFMAQLLAAGRLYGDSPPMKIFFDHRMMVNDGKVFAQYFLGWPALMVPGVGWGGTGYMNAVYSAATVPALFLTVRRLAGSGWARLGVVLFLVSPMLAVGAATELSHTSCLMALFWLVWSSARGRDDGAPWWTHSLVGFFFCLAFFIRPWTALGAGAPFLVYWWIGLGWLSGRRRAGALAFLVPVVLMAGMFLAAGKVQTGSYFRTAYQSLHEYAKGNHFLFSLWSFRDPPAEIGLAPDLRPRSAREMAARLGSAALRFAYAIHGWPLTLVFLPFAAGRGLVRCLWWSAAGLLAFNAFVADVGVDVFGPVHYFELALPYLVLGVIGIRDLGRRLAAHRVAGGRTVPVALALAMTAVAAVGYAPIRFREIRHITETTRKPFDKLRELGVSNAVVFATHPWIMNCPYEGLYVGWVYSHPTNDPWLENDVLWVNHLSKEADLELMRRVFPDRRAYLTWWEDCEVRMAPLERVRTPPAPEMEVIVEKGVRLDR